MRVIFAGILCLANLAVLVTAAGAEDYRGEFLSTVVASEGGGGDGRNTAFEDIGDFEIFFGHKD